MAATIVTRKHQPGTVVRAATTGAAVASGTCGGVIAPPTGMRDTTTAATRASTTVTATAGRQPQPMATQTPTVSGPTSPTDEPIPLPSVNAADALPPCRR